MSVQLERADTRTHALGRMEWLDVWFDGHGSICRRAARAGPVDPERLRRLARALPLADLSLTELLRDLVLDDDNRWRQPWVRACALHASASVPELATHTLDLTGETSSIVRETAAAIRSRSAAQSAQP